MQRQYWVRAQMQTAGPLSWEELQRWAVSGTLPPSAEVSADGWSGSVAAAQVPGLHLPSSAPPAEASLLMPTNVDGVALVAGYLGLAAVTVVGAPFALAAGLWALVRLRQNPTRNGKGRAVFGVVMGVVFSTLGLVALVV